jgi:hypothetical protein
VVLPFASEVEGLTNLPKSNLAAKADKTVFH